MDKKNPLLTVQQSCFTRTFPAFYPLLIPFNFDNIFNQTIGCLVHTLLKRSPTLYTPLLAYPQCFWSPNIMHGPPAEEASMVGSPVMERNHDARLQLVESVLSSGFSWIRGLSTRVSSLLQHCSSPGPTKSSTFGWRVQPHGLKGKRQRCVANTLNTDCLQRQQTWDIW